MGAIQNLTINDTVTGSTYIAVTIDGQDMRVTPAVLNTYLQTITTSSLDKATQYSAPSATGFSVQVTDTSANTWLILTPVAGYATGTIVMPALANAIDKQEMMVNCTQAVTTLTVDGNGATVTGEPAAFVANDFFTLRFDAVTDTWYRVK